MKETPTGCWFVRVASVAFFAHLLSALPVWASNGDGSDPIVFAQIPRSAGLQNGAGRAGGTLRGDYGDGGRIVRLDADGQVRLLSEGFDSACDPDVSFDGKRILFAARRSAGDVWNIWEMNADGSGVRQVTRDAGNCRSPAYQATLYTIVSKEPWYQIMFVSDVAGLMDEVGSGLARSLYSCRLDGSGLRRLTMNLSDDMDPFLMPDGRVLLASWQRMDLRRGPLGRVALFGVNTDGADYALFQGDQGLRVKHMPCVTSDGLVVFVESDAVDWDGAGQLASVTWRRHYYSHRFVTGDPKYLYHSPSPGRDGSILVSRRLADGSATHGLYRLDPVTGEAELVFDDPEFHDIDAVLLSPRPEPDGRSSVVNEKQATGKLYCLNAYLSDPLVRPHLPPGSIHGVRVIEGVPVSPDDRTARGIGGLVPRRLLGEVPVEADGSFHIELWPDVPVQLQTLDADGMALRSCGWIWTKHREPRGCIGCHEDPELTPENRFVDALKKPGVKLLLGPGKRRTVDFRREVMPIVSGRCSTVQCHGGGGVAPDLSDKADGPFNRAYVSLLAGVADAKGDGPVRGKFVTPGEARSSPLIWRLYGRNTSRPWDATCRPDQIFAVMPPEPAKLTDDEKRVFVEWIDFGALWESGKVGSQKSEVRSEK